MSESGPHTPLNPGEATQRDEVRRTLEILSIAVAVFGTTQVAAGLSLGSMRTLVTGVLFGSLAVWLMAFPRRALTSRPVTSVIASVAAVAIVVPAAVTFLQPFSAIVAAMALLIPIAAALPFLEARPLRWLMLLAWLGIVAALGADFIPGDPAVPAMAATAIRIFGLVLGSGIVLFLLYRSSERMKASSREFGRLFQLSSDLAETTEPAVLGQIVARHLAEATDFDDCVIYALASDTDRLAPFGSHPAQRSLQVDAESLAERPILRRVIHDRARIVIQASDGRADPIEVSRLRSLGREVMLLLPLVAQGAPVGVAELTASGRGAVDERRLALARTLAFEAAMAIENGRLYHQLRHRALHDSLTGLANRSLFHDRVEHALARLARRGTNVAAVLFIDLDDFKRVNDTLGHARGDRLLTLVAERLRTVVRPEDTVARLGGDEFALLLEELASGDEALAIAERALEAIAVPFELAHQPVSASISIGVAVRAAEGTTVEELLQEADAAMYQAKRDGKGRAVLFVDASSARGAINAVVE